MCLKPYQAQQDHTIVHSSRDSSQMGFYKDCEVNRRNVHVIKEFPRYVCLHLLDLILWDDVIIKRLILLIIKKLSITHLQRHDGVIFNCKMSGCM